jgi:hypothetical protein
MHLNDPSVYLRMRGYTGTVVLECGSPDALRSQRRRGIPGETQGRHRRDGSVLLCSLLSRSDADKAHVEGVR